MLRRIVLCGLAMTLALTLSAPAPAQQGDPRGMIVRVLRDPRIEGRRVAMVMSDWLYCYPPTRELILVPAGYVTDFASIPPQAQALISPYGDNIEGAVVHDWLFAVGEPGQFDKANQIFRYALMESGVDTARRAAMHRMVQTAGRAAYGRAGEWSQRFGDRDTGAFPVPPPFPRRRSAVVGRIDGACQDMDKPAVRAALYGRYRSDRWRRPRPTLVIPGLAPEPHTRRLPRPTPRATGDDAAPRRRRRSPGSSAPRRTARERRRPPCRPRS